MYKKLIALLLLCTLSYSYGHTETEMNTECAASIPIPDPNFEIALFNLGIDDMPGDGQVSMGAVMNVMDLNLSNQFISDLSGIENFTALQTLNVSGNNLTNLNLNGLPQLINLYANDNMLNVLDLNGNPSLQRVEANNNNLFQVNIQNLSALVELSLNSNNLSMLEVFNNMNLEIIRVANNMLMNFEVGTLTNLKILDVSGNSLQNITLDPLVNLENLTISNNQFSSINLGFNSALINFDAQYNQLTTIDVTSNSALRILRLNNNSLTTANLRNGNNTNILSINLTGNSGLNCVLVDDGAYSTSNWTNIDAQTQFTSTDYCRYTTIPDTNFEAALAMYDDIPADGQVPTELIEVVTNLDLINQNISNLTGIEDFTALQILNVTLNNLGSLDLSGNTNLTELAAAANSISSLNLSANILLEKLFLSGNALTTINVSTNTALKELDLDSNNLNTLNLSTNVQLEQALFGNNLLESLDLTTNTALTDISVRNNALTYLNLKNGNNTNVTSFLAINNPNLSCILVDDETYSTNNWTGIDATTSFSDTYCRYTAVPDLNFEEGLRSLGYDDIADDGLVPTALIENVQSILVANLAISDLTGIEDFTALQSLEVDFNDLTQIDLSQNLNLTYLNVDRNSLTSLDLTANTLLETIILSENNLTELDMRNGTNTNIVFFDARTNPNLNCIAVDDVAYSAANWTNIDAQTQFSTTGYCRYTAIPDSNFEAALHSLGYDDTAADGQVPTALIETVTSLYLSQSGTSNLTGIEDFTALESFTLDTETIPTVNLSSNSQLQTVTFNDCNISNLVVDSNPLLDSIEFDSSNEQSVITSIDLSNSPLLRQLEMDNVGLTNLSLPSNIQNLIKVHLSGNNLETLDLSGAIALSNIAIPNSNTLNYLNLKNGNNTNVNVINLVNNPNLTCVIVDDEAYSTINWTNVDATTSFSDTYCRYTTIPNANFEAALEALGYDDITADGQVPTALIETVTSLDIRNSAIADLTGIQDFLALRTLRATNNSLTNLDLSQNVDLDFLWCEQNSLTSLDLSNNTEIRFVSASNNNIPSFDATGLTQLGILSLWSNQISSLDVTGATALRELSLFGNSLTELDVSQNAALEEIGIRNNSITSLNLTNNPALISVDVRGNGMTYLNVKNGFNTNITNFRANDNSNLNCILVDDAAYSTTNWTNIDAQTSFSSTYCRYTAIPDANFEAALEALGYDDISGDGQVPTVLIETVDYLSVENKNIADATGIEDFTALDDLYISNNSLTSLDLSNNLALKYVFCSNNNLTSINITANTLLEHINCNGNNLPTINVSNNVLLESLNASDNPIATLDITANTALEELYVTNTSLTTLDVSANTGLYELEISDSPFETIDLATLSQLSVFYANNTNLTTLDLSNNAMFNELEANNTPLTFVNLKNGNNTNISDVYLENTPNLTCVLVDDATYSTNFWTDIDPGISFSDTFCRYTAIPDAQFEAQLSSYDDIPNDGQVPTANIETITTLDIADEGILDATGIQDFIALETLDAYENPFTTIDLSNNVNLERLDLSNCPLTELDLNNLVNLLELNLVNNNLTSLDLSANTALTSFISTGNSIASYDLRNNTALNIFVIVSSATEFINIKNGNNTNITNPTIYGATNLCVSVDDSQYTVSTWSNVQSSSIFTDSYCRYTQIPDANFEVRLNELGYDDIPNDGQVPTIIIENVTSLFSSEDLISDLTGIQDFKALKTLTLKENNFTTIDLSQNTLLESINFEESLVATVDVSNNVLLKTLDLNQTLVTSIDVSNNVLLENLNLQSLDLTELDVSNNPLLTYLNIGSNNIVSLDVSNNSNLTELIAFGNEDMTSLNIQNGNNTNITSFRTSGNNLLTCVLVDDAAYSTANWTDIASVTSFSDTSCGNNFALNIQVFLQGAALNPNAGETNLMRDDLRVAGYIPTTSPYADGITCEATVFTVTGADAIVDWIWVELREVSSNTTISYARSALLQRDGDIVDVDGVSALDFSTTDNTYYIAIKHRSHLGIMSQNAITFTTGVTNTVNFKNFNDSVLFGSNPQTFFGMPTEIYGMWCGNVNGDATVQYSGTSPDTPNILSEVLNDSGNFLNFPTYSLTGYNDNDANMDGIIQYSGTNPDTPYILQNVLAHPANFFGFSTYSILEQLPENSLAQ